MYEFVTTKATQLATRPKARIVTVPGMRLASNIEVELGARPGVGLAGKEELLIPIVILHIY